MDRQFYERLVRELGERRYRTIPGAVQVRQTIDLVIGAIEAALEGECKHTSTFYFNDTNQTECRDCGKVI